MLSVVIPALNVENTIAGVVEEMLKSKIVTEVIVVDNGSEDRTSSVAVRSGAKLVTCPTRGMGSAIQTGLAVTKNSTVLKIDGDIRNPNLEWVQILSREFLKNGNFVSSYYSSDYDEFPVGNLVAKPLIKILAPQLVGLEMPLAGTYAFNKNVLDWKSLPSNWSFDLALHLDAYERFGDVQQVYIGELNDRKKKIVEYKGMAEELMGYLIARYADSNAI